jgi:hypothetical protein
VISVSARKKKKKKCKLTNHGPKGVVDNSKQIEKVPQHTYHFRKLKKEQEKKKRNRDVIAQPIPME